MGDLKPTEFLRFEETPNEGKKTRCFTVVSVNHGIVLGKILWRGAWRQYVFEPEAATVFNNTCLTDIADRVSYLNIAHRVAREHADLAAAEGDAMSDFRKRPVVIQAVRVWESEDIPTLEGTMTAAPGDWIITGIKGERYPCKDDVFRATYEAVDDEGKVALAAAGKETP